MQTPSTTLPVPPATPILLYGIANCTTVKKARAWFQERDIQADFHDYKKQGAPTDRLSIWMETVDWQTLLNRQGTTWRKLDATIQAHAQNAVSAAALMREYPSLIKRPVVEWDDGCITVGFDPQTWNQWLDQASKQHHC